MVKSEICNVIFNTYLSVLNLHFKETFSLITKLPHAWYFIYKITQLLNENFIFSNYLSDILHCLQHKDVHFFTADLLKTAESRGNHLSIKIK